MEILVKVKNKITKIKDRLAQLKSYSRDKLGSSDLPTRKRYVNLVESVKNNGGDVKIFSSLHVSGEQLGQLTGVAAILRFPMPDLELEEFEDDSSDDED